MVIALLGLTPSLALAQADHSGNGGGVHVCYDGKKVDANGDRIIKSIEMYDLYETSERYKIKSGVKPDAIPSSLTTEADFLNYAYQRTAELASIPENNGNGGKAMAARLEAAVALVEKKIVPTDQELDLVYDAKRLMHGKNCIYDQLANWDDRTNQLFVKADYYEMIKKLPLSLAAFKTHEAFYFLDRRYHDAQNSDDSREANGKVYLGSNAGLAVQVDEATRNPKTGLTMIHPQYTSAACYPYAKNDGHDVDGGNFYWDVYFKPVKATVRMPRMATYIRQDTFFPGKRELVNLEKIWDGHWWGNAIGKFDLLANPNGIDLQLYIKMDECGQTWDVEIQQKKGNFAFGVDP